MSIANLKDTGNQGNNMPWQWQMLKGLQAIYDEVKQPLTCVDDSVSICTNGTPLTSTTIGADTGLDVNIIGGVTLEVNLDAANDQVGVYGYVNGASGSPVPLNTNASGQAVVAGGTGVQRTPSFARPSTASPGTGTVTAGAYSASFASVGTANALVGGIILKPGETLNFDAGAINNTLAAITYDVTTNSGAELIIITLV